MSAAKIIKKIRYTLGLSQLDLAQEVNVTATTVSCWECNKRNPSFRVSRKLVALAKKNGMELTFSDIRPDISAQI